MSALIVRQIWELLLGEKTQTRRLKLPQGMIVGKKTAVVPGRGKHSWWLGEWGTRVIVVENPVVFVSNHLKSTQTNKDAQAYLEKHFFVRTEIEISQIWVEPLCEISYYDATCEGVKDQNAYMRLWNSINSTKGYTWRDNPEVCCIQFQRTDELARMVSLMKTQKLGKAA
jgi:hypothetical protein